MASAMASLVTGATSSVALPTQCSSKRTISRSQRLPQSVSAIRSLTAARFGYGDGLLLSSSQFKSIRSECRSKSIVCVTEHVDSSSSSNSRGSNGSVIASGVVSCAVLVAGVVLQAVVRGVKALGETLTATPLPDGSTNAEKELVNALKGRLVLAVGPLFFASISQTPGAVSTPLTVVASGMAKWLELYSGVLMVRVLLSWFPNIPWERQPLQAVRDMCDPYLNLFRNIIPPLFNALDLSPMLAFMVLGVLTSILNTTAR